MDLPATTKTVQEIKAYYDAHVVGKLKGFVEGNARVERAWETIVRWAPHQPGRVLEVGCGIGDIAWRMMTTWPDAEVVGIDLSERSIATARTLFQAPRLKFTLGPLEPGVAQGSFDLVVLMDVYEHIRVEERDKAHQALKLLRKPAGRIFLSFPTPRFQAFLRRERPHRLQPVDEDISFETISRLAHDISAEVLLYEQISVWHTGDYGHAVLGNDPWAHLGSRSTSWWASFRTTLSRRLAAPPVPSKKQRLEMVRSRLGADVVKELAL